MGRVAVFVRDPFCSLDCGQATADALSPENDCRLIGSVSELSDSDDLVVYPGGLGDADKGFRKSMTRDDHQRVRDYVASGGRYLGICMGAYWAGREYFDLLDNLDAVQYIKHPGAYRRRSYGTVTPVSWRGELVEPFFYDGCCFVGEGERVDVAHYLGFHDRVPAAIIQGRVGAIGPHPESRESWYTDSWRWSYMPEKWHGGRHHELLRGFARELMAVDNKSNS